MKSFIKVIYMRQFNPKKSLAIPSSKNMSQDG